MTGIPTVQSPQGVTRRTFTRRRLLSVAAASAVGLAFYGGEFERHNIEVVPRTISLNGLPDAFDGYRIVQISDIHLEEFTEATFLKLVIRMTNELRPDLVVLTGDFVSNLPMPRRWAVRWAYECGELLSQLDCKARYAVLGNHDPRVNAAAVTDALTTHGIEVLKNRFVPLEREGKRIWLAGVADVLEEKPDLSLAIPHQSTSSREPVILLCHEPDYVDAVINRGVSLMLSGHTHGGQVRLPFIPPLHLPPLGKKYLEGHFLLPDGMQLYVNRGIGTVGIPFRFLCSPELTVFTLAQNSA